MWIGALSLRASRFASWERAASSISSERRPITSPKIQISLSVYRPMISMSVACHKASKRLSGVPLEMASFNSRSIDIGDPSCFPLLTRNCANRGVRWPGIGQSRARLRTRILFEERETAARACDAPVVSRSIRALQRVMPTPSIMAVADPALKLPRSRQNSATNWLTEPMHFEGDQHCNTREMPAKLLSKIGKEQQVRRSPGLQSSPACEGRRDSL